MCLWTNVRRTVRAGLNLTVLLLVCAALAAGCTSSGGGGDEGAASDDSGGGDDSGDDAGDDGGDDDGGDDGGSDEPPFIGLVNFQAASVAIGQPDFAQNLGNRGLPNPTSATLNNASGGASIADEVLYVPDCDNGRVLGFEGVPATNGADASMVWGQPDFSTGTPGPPATGFLCADSVLADGDRLIVSDDDNNRVLIFDPRPTSSGGFANIVVGQADLSGTAPGCAANALFGPEGVYAVADKLLVADRDNHRVLIWDPIPIATGQPADLVLGQSGFDSCNPNAGLVSPTAQTLEDPSDVWSDGTRLAVLDQTNNRVLIWTEFPAENFAAADIVVGQASMTTNTAGTGQADLNDPRYLSSNGTQLFVSDQNNHRVLIWNSFPSQDHAAADVVLGQDDFVSSAPNDDDQNGSEDGQPSARTFNNPSGIRAAGNLLLVTDRDNNRVLIFQSGAPGIAADLDDIASAWEVYVEGSPTWTLENVATPSLDGTALRCAITGGVPYSNVHCYRNLDPASTATDFLLRLDFYMSATTCNNAGSPSVVQALEFTMNTWIAGLRYEWALQWENVGIGGPQWRYWDANAAGGWVSFDPPIPQCLAGEQWHELEVTGNISNGLVHYQGFSIDGVTYSLNLSVSPASEPETPDKMAVAVQADGNSTETSYDLFIDGVRFEWFRPEP